MQRQSPKAAQGGTDFAMLPSAHRKPERRDSKAFKMETQFNTGRAWFLSVALLLGTLGFVLVDLGSPSLEVWLDIPTVTFLPMP